MGLLDAMQRVESYSPEAAEGPGFGVVQALRAHGSGFLSALAVRR